MTTDSGAHIRLNWAHWGTRSTYGHLGPVCPHPTHSAPPFLTKYTPHALLSLVPDGVHSCGVHTSWWLLEGPRKRGLSRETLPECGPGWGVQKGGDGCGA